MVGMKHNVNGLQMKTYKTGRSVVDWANISSFTVDGHEVQVIKNENVVKVSKNGNERKERRLTLTIDGINSVEVGTESVKKGSFITRLLKVTVVEQPKQQQEVEELDQWDERRFTRLYTDYDAKQENEMKSFLDGLLEECKNRDDINRDELNKMNEFWADESEFNLDELEAMVGYNP